MRKLCYPSLERTLASAESPTRNSYLLNADGRERLAFGIEPATTKFPLRLARYVAFAEFLRDELGRKGALQLLDVGCGVGKLRLACPEDRIDFTGIDVRTTSLEIARRNGYARLLQGNLVGALPFADESFDALVCSHVLEHLPNPKDLVREILRVLRPGGIFLMATPMSWWWNRWLRMHVLPLLVPEKKADVLAANYGHVTFFTMSSLKALLRAFVIEDIRGFRFFSSRHLPLENWWWYYRLNTLWGKTFPRLTADVNVAARKPFADRPGHLPSR